MVVSGASKSTSFDRGVARELVVVLTASDNMAVYRCNANNEAKKTVSAQTRLKVYCESDATLQSTIPDSAHFIFLIHGRAVTAIGLKITARQTELRRGQTLTLECSCRTSNPKASIFWSLGAHRFVSQRYLTFVKLGRLSPLNGVCVPGWREWNRPPTAPPMVACQFTVPWL